MPGATFLTAAGAVLRRAEAWLLQIAGVSVFALGSAAAADAIRVEVPSECRAETRAVESTYPFIDRVGDPRFAPAPLHVAADAITMVRPQLDGLLAAGALTADRQTLLIATYLDIRSLNIRTGEVARLDADLGNLNNKKYVPTGIAIGPETGKVFLANYEADNILIGSIAGARIVFEQALTGDGLISPENIAITPNESWVVSANFDGNSATAFARAGGQYVEKWKTDITFAHGVAILGDLVFVSSLELRQIFVLDLSTGQKIGSFGRPGWNASCLEFLWPTGIAVDENNILTITDAHTGGIYRIAFAGRVGKLLDVVGGTTPGPAGLQMPYSTIPVGTDLAILSTFSPKVVIIDPSPSSAERSIKALIVQHAHQAEPLPDRDRSLSLGIGWNGHVHLATVPVSIDGFLAVPSYGTLVKVKLGQALKTDGLLLLKNDTLRLFGALMYFIEAHTVMRGVVLSSPSAPYALYVTQGQANCFAKVDLPGPALATATGLDHRRGLTPYDEIEDQALVQLHKLDLRRGPDGFLSLSAIAEELNLPPDQVRAEIRTGAGEDALAELVRCHEESCGREARKTAIDRYKVQSGMSSDIPFFELLLLEMSAHRCVD